MVVTSSEMIGLESAVYFPPQKFNIAQALSRSTTAIQISGKIKYHELCWFSLVPNRSFLGATRRKKSLFPAFVSDLSSASPESDQDNARRKSPNVQILLKRFWEVAAPYWFSDDKVAARWRLAGVFALTLGTTGISVGFNFLGRDFYNALANKDQEQFTKQLMYYLAAFAIGIPVSTLLHFLRGCMCLGLLFPNIFGYKITARLPKDNVAWKIFFTYHTPLKVFVLRDYAKDTLSLRWRSWMTSYYMNRYLKNRTFYKIQSQSIIDNPDQRIVDDLSSFTATALAFSLTLFNASVDLISFSNILYGIYPPLFLVLLGYSLGGTAISIVLGRGLVNLNFLQEKKEADFRYGLVRIRENAESIAFYGGEQNEMQLLMQRFRSAFENLSQLLISSRNLEFFTNGYRYLIQILPAAVVAPMYFSGKIEFGVINQSVSAFNHILGDFSLIVYQFQALSAFSAVIERLGEFDDLLNNKDTRSDADNLEEICRELCIISDFSTSNGSVPFANSSKLMTINHLTLMTPSGATLIRDLSLDVYEGNHLLVTGPSGSGKTSLLRAVAGLWSFGKGTITSYERNEGDPLSQFSSNLASLEVSSVEETMGNENRRKNERSRGVFFLPQKPYMVLGTLRQQLLYPTWCEDSISMSDNNKPTGSLPFLTMAQDMDSRPQKPTTEDIIQVLHDVRLGYILSRFDLDSMSEWSSVLSLGEQQRLAFARLLLSKPTLVLLDESTSALDEANETNIYRLIEAAGITYVSIGHRKTLYEYHKQVLRISPVEPTNADPNWHFEPINETSTYNLSKQ